MQEKENRCTQSIHHYHNKAKTNIQTYWSVPWRRCVDLSQMIILRVAVEMTTYMLGVRQHSFIVRPHVDGCGDIVNHFIAFTNTNQVVGV